MKIYKENYTYKDKDGIERSGYHFTLELDDGFTIPVCLNYGSDKLRKVVYRKLIKTSENKPNKPNNEEK